MSVEGVQQRYTLIQAGSENRSNKAFVEDDAREVPSVSRRQSANSARKRRHGPDLSRLLASPSPGDKISMMFQDSALHVQSKRSPLTTATPNTGRSRIPLAQARHTRFGQSPRTPEGSPYSYKTPPKLPVKSLSNEFSILEPSDEIAISEVGCEPTSSGYVTRMASPNAHDSVYPTLPQISSTEPSSGDEEGVRMIMPISHVEAEEAQQTGIRIWLDSLKQPGEPKAASHTEIREGDTSCHHMPQQYDNQADSPSNTSSNKENISPPKSPSPIRPPITYLTANPPSRFRNLNTQLPTCSPAHNSQTPSSLPDSKPRKGHFSFPARRKRPFPAQVPILVQAPQSSSSSTNGDDSPPPSQVFTIHQDTDCLPNPQSSTHKSTTPRDFTIQNESHLATALAQLSPTVELRRKGRAHRGRTRKQERKQRCASYWDDDVLEPGSPAYRSRPSNARQEDETVGREDIDEESTDVAMEGQVARRLRSGKMVRVLGDSEDSEEMTREKPFMREAEGCEFRGVG